MQPQNPLLPGSRYSNFYKLVFFALVAVYLADCFTPLRLHVDSLRYYAIMECIRYGCPADSSAATDYFPYGYTALLLLFLKLGILKSFAIVFINDIYLFGGLFFLYQVFRKTISPFLYFVIVLLNWIFVKFVTHPLSEMQYIFFSLGSIFFFYQFILRKKIQWLALSLVFGWVAFLTRTVGITLIGAIAVGLIWEFRVQQLAFLRNNKLLVGGILAILIAALIIFSKPLGINHYGNVLSEHFKEAPFFKRIGWRFKEWGEIFVNTPSNKFIDYVAKAGEFAFIALGLIIFCWFVYRLYFSKNTIPFFIKAYFLFYCLIMFNWPFNDPRFWAPVMPVMAAIVLQLYADEKNKISRLFFSGLFIVYMFLGSFAAGYMVYTSFNKKVFARTQAKGVFRTEYEIHFFGKPLNDTATQTDPFVIHVLQQYDR